MICTAPSVQAGYAAMLCISEAWERDVAPAGFRSLGGRRVGCWEPEGAWEEVKSTTHPGISRDILGFSWVNVRFSGNKKRDLMG